MGKTKSKKNTLFIILLILVPIFIFGYMVYSNNSGYEYEVKTLEDVEDVNVGEVVFYDPEHNYHYFSNDNYTESLTIPAKAMDESNGIFFIGHDDISTDGGYGSIEIATKESTNEEINGNLDNGYEVFYRDLTPFLNTNYEKMGDKEGYYLNSSGGASSGRMFPKQALGGMSAEIDETFGTEIYDYFQEHELTIKCEDLTLEKICVSSDIKFKKSCTTTTGYYESTESYIWVGTATVTTEHAVGDMDEFGVFGNDGETVTIKIYARGSNFGVYDMHFERI